MSRLRFEGVDELVKTLTELGRAGYDQAAGALWEAGEEIMTDARKVTPVDTGALRSSARVTVLQNGRKTFESGTEWSGQTMTRSFTVGTGLPTTTKTDVVLSYGGPAASYALYVHEAPDSWQWNAKGTGPKYLERPFRAAASNIGRTIAAKVRKRLEYVAR